jgi:hypothetical protein
MRLYLRSHRSSQPGCAKGALGKIIAVLLAQLHPASAARIAAIPNGGPIGSSQCCLEPPGRLTPTGHHFADLGDRVRH